MEDKLKNYSERLKKEKKNDALKMLYNWIKQDIIDLDDFKYLIKNRFKDSKKLSKLNDDKEHITSTYHITTNMGRCRDNLPFLSIEEMDNFNNIGYSGKTLDGVRTSMESYLNNLNKGTFSVNQIKFDSGDFVEKFIITKTFIPK